MSKLSTFARNGRLLLLIPSKRRVLRVNHVRHRGLVINFHYRYDIVQIYHKVHSSGMSNLCHPRE